MADKYLLVAYDIANDKRRNKLAKYLGSRIVRRQESLFEGWLPEVLFAAFIERIETLINHDEDTVRVFQLPQSVQESVRLLGRRLPLIPRDNATIL